MGNPLKIYIDDDDSFIYPPRMICFSRSFIDGICGSALKKDNLVKHSKSDMHGKALGMLMRKLTDIYMSTPKGKAMAGATPEERSRVSKLMEIAYFIASEEILFLKFPGLLELKKRHGVSLGSTYATRQKCNRGDFTEPTADAILEPVIDGLKSSRGFSLLIDSLTDSSVTEKELAYLSFIGSIGDIEVHFLALKNVQDATAES